MRNGYGGNSVMDGSVGAKCVPSAVVVQSDTPKAYTATTLASKRVCECRDSVIRAASRARELATALHGEGATGPEGGPSNKSSGECGALHDNLSALEDSLRVLHAELDRL